MGVYLKIAHISVDNRLRTCFPFCLNCSFFSNVFIKIHEYSNKSSFITSHKVRALCLYVTLI